MKVQIGWQIKGIVTPNLQFLSQRVLTTSQSALKATDLSVASIIKANYEDKWRKNRNKRIDPEDRMDVGVTYSNSNENMRSVSQRFVRKLRNKVLVGCAVSHVFVVM